MNNQELISKLRATGQASLPPAQAEKIRQALLVEFRRVTSEASGRYIERKRFYQLIPKPMIVAAIASIIIALGLGTSTAANAARPGDFLYGWDLATERVRLALTFGETGKAEYEAQTAEERVQEQLELEARNSDHALEASAQAEAALDQAIIKVAEIRLKLEGQNGSGAETLTKVEARLRELRDRHDESGDTLQVEAETANGQTKVHVEFEQSRWEWTSTVTERNALIAEIAQRTGQTVADIQAVLKLEVSDSNEADDDNENRNSNRNTNSASTVPTNRASDDANDDQDDDSAQSNRNTNSAAVNTNTDDDEDESGNQQSIRVRVELEDGKTEIRTSVNGQTQEWELNSVTESVIIASITSKTGLSAAAITSSWDFEQR